MISSAERKPVLTLPLGVAEVIFSSELVIDTKLHDTMTKSGKKPGERVGRWYFGGLASAGAACITHPLDLLKVHLQERQTWILEQNAFNE